MVLRLTSNKKDLKWLNSDLYPITKSSNDQEETEELVKQYYYHKLDNNSLILSRAKISRELQIKYLRNGLKKLPNVFQSLDASHPWLCYWILHALTLLGDVIPKEQNTHIVQYLAKCQSPNGGFGGGPYQLPHLATTYAAVMALAILGTEEAYSAINRATLQNYLHKMHQKSGGFIMHDDGEEDIRGAYCASAVAYLTNIRTQNMFADTPYWLSRCQTYEGGFSARPSLEAHGGYGFCGFASLLLLGEPQKADINRLLHWAAARQMRIEGGFQGRTNKLVDSCYSFWVGALFPLIDSQLKSSKSHNLFDRESLQEYILYCCQYRTGGITDRPPNLPDYYHTCYALSGISLAQHSGPEKCIVGDPDNELEKTHPLLNINITAAQNANEYFHRLAVPQQV